MTHSVLVIDDEPITRYLLRRVLEGVGFQVVEAEYGLDALAKIRQEQPDIMILDARQQDDAGFAVCRAPQAEGGERLSVVMLGARTQLATIQEILHTGIARYLPKPVSSSDLLARVEEVMCYAPVGD
ncbi:MAG TPA: response regulator [Anaerolineae bacterium]|nr:response regulator [Anaerolineae bacterium]